MIHACALLGAALALAFSTALEVQFALPKLLVVRTAATVIAIIWIRRAMRDQVRTLPRAVGVTAALVLAWWIVAAAGAVHVPTALAGAHGRYNGLWSHAIWLLLSLAIGTSGLDARAVATLCRWLVAAVMPSALYAMAQFAGLDPIAWPGPRSASTIGNPVVLAATLGLFTPIALVFAFLARSFPSRAFWTVAVVVLMGGALSTLSRGPLLATAIAMMVVVAAVAADARPRVPARSLAIGGAIVLVLAAAGYRQVLDVRARLMGPGEAAKTLSDRQNTYAAAWRIVQDRPMRGVGFENFSIVYPQYRRPESEQVTPNVVPTMVHSGYLQAAATTGVPGLVLYLAFVGAVLITVARAWRASRDRQHRLVLAGLAASLIGYLVQDLSGWLEISLTTFFYVIAGVALASSNAGSVHTLPTSRWPVVPLAAVAGTVCAVLAIEAVELLRVDRLMRRSRALDVQQHWDQIESTLSSALNSRARLPAEYFNLAGLRYADRYAVANARPIYVESAALFDHAISLNPFAISPRLNRLSLDALAIQRQLPITEVESRAADLVAMDANNGAVHETIARLRLAQGRRDEATAALGAAEALRPGDPRHDELRGDIEHARNNSPAALAAYRQAVAGYEPEQRAMWVAASRKLLLGLLQSGLATEASAHADRVLADFPRDTMIHTLRGYARLALGDPVEARRAFQAALVIDPKNISARQGLNTLP